VARWFRWSLSVADPFVCRCLTSPAMLPFPHPAHRTGGADLPHPALGEDSRHRHSHCMGPRLASENNLGVIRLIANLPFLSSLLASAFNCSPFPPPESPGFVSTTSRSYDSIRFGLPRNRGGSAPAVVFPGLLSVYSRYGLHARQVALQLFTPKASAASLPPPLLRLLPGGANQFPGGFHSRWTTTLHGAPGLSDISETEC
jgi:hypothetical protein